MLIIWIFIFQKNLTDDEQKKVIACWLAYKYPPLNFFDDEVTQHFFLIINLTYNMPRRNPMKWIVIEQYEEMKSSLKIVLRDNPFKFSFTIEAWSALNTRSYYEITIHWIDKEWLMQAIALDFIPSNAKHKGWNIANFVLKSTKEFEVKYFIPKYIFT